jgi:hypothetical protein
LERNSEEALKSWDKEQRMARRLYPLLLLLATATTLWLIVRTYQEVMK